MFKYFRRLRRDRVHFNVSYSSHFYVGRAAQTQHDPCQGFRQNSSATKRRGYKALQKSLVNNTPTAVPRFPCSFSPFLLFSGLFSSSSHSPFSRYLRTSRWLYSESEVAQNGSVLLQDLGRYSEYEHVPRVHFFFFFFKTLASCTIQEKQMPLILNAEVQWEVGDEGTHYYSSIGMDVCGALRYYTLKGIRRSDDRSSAGSVISS